MKIKKIFYFSILLICLLTQSIQLTIHAQTNESEMSESILSADYAIRQAYTHVLEAENACANVSELVAKLNIAAGYLAEAQNAYVTGNFDIIAGKCRAAMDIANDVTVSAIILRDNALFETNNNFKVTLFFSVIGITLFLMLLYVIWRKFKTYYFKRLLELKPELIS